MKAAEEITINEHIVLKRLSHDSDQVKYDTIVKNREHLLPWLPWAHGYAEFKEITDFTNLMIENFDKGVAFGYEIYYDGDFVGSIDFHDVSEEHKRVEIGYWLDQDHTGKGIMTSTVEKLTNYAFKDLDIHRVVIRAATENHASCAIAERLGFKKEATLTDEQYLDGKYYDTALYAKINPNH